MVTKIISGGYNGLSDRLENFTEIGLRVLGYGAGNVRQFQGVAGLPVDSIAGRNTRAAIQVRLEALPDLAFGEAAAAVDTPSVPADAPSRDPEHAAVLVLAQIAA
ncbi:peptidoglycan-binding domain-containing protein [uncultured Sulfitobacter sp.]|uniref:peptidoglycan-binding domain-containing protein n=1 Tax=uncultured Sulfitobacter sp. TaxID=191468 RepID=UPI0026356E3E|nr:peptidoglycan-binding domain-containing protein [uncultured Sulfitobacter sp.]